MKTWILLRGLMRESRHWGDFPNQFTHALEIDNLVTIDFPGNGSLHAQKSLRSIGEMANFCRAQLTQMGLKPPFNVLALSLGAMVAVEWSANHPNEFTRLVLINTSLAPHNPFFHRLRPRNYPALLGQLVFGSVRQRENLILQLTSRLKLSPLQTSSLLDQWASYASDFPVARGNIFRQLFAAASYRAPALRPNVPLLLLAGQEDQLVNVKCSTTLAARWEIPALIHPTAGHDLPLDDAEWVCKKVKEWTVATD